MNETSVPSRQNDRNEMNDLVHRLFPDLDEPASAGGFSNKTTHNLTLVHPDEEVDISQQPAADAELDLDEVAEERFEGESPLLSDAAYDELLAKFSLCDAHSSGGDFSIQPSTVRTCDESSRDTLIPSFDIVTGEQTAIPCADLGDPDPAETWRPTPESPAATPAAACVPKQIGDGKLVPVRLTWKPGDPFGQPSRPKKNAFKWEIMLTTACVTAACGMVCMWLLRTVLA